MTVDRNYFAVEDTVGVGSVYCQSIATPRRWPLHTLLPAARRETQTRESLCSQCFVLLLIVS